MHALIIEDDDLIAIAIEEVLRERGFTSFDVAVVEARFRYRCGPDYLL